MPLKENISVTDDLTFDMYMSYSWGVYLVKMSRDSVRKRDVTATHDHVTLNRSM